MHGCVAGGGPVGWSHGPVPSVWRNVGGGKVIVGEKHNLEFLGGGKLAATCFGSRMRVSNRFAIRGKIRRLKKTTPTHLSRNFGKLRRGIHTYKTEREENLEKALWEFLFLCPILGKHEERLWSHPWQENRFSVGGAL